MVFLIGIFIGLAIIFIPLYLVAKRFDKVTAQRKAAIRKTMSDIDNINKNLEKKLNN